MADLIDRAAATEKLQTILAYHRTNAASGVVGAAVEERMAAAVESCIAALAAIEPAKEVGVDASLIARANKLADDMERHATDEWDESELVRKLIAALEPAQGTWMTGEPPSPWREEWFIAKTIHGDKVVLRALPEEWTYDYTTADHTYMIAANIVCWMQFPDSDYIAPTADEASRLAEAGGACPYGATGDDCCGGYCRS